MPRSPIVIEAKNSVGAPVASASVTITDRHTGALSSVYSVESGGSTITNPLTADAAGRATCWAERGDYMATVSGSGITTYSIPVSAAASADGTMVSPWFQSAILPTATVGKSIIATTETTTSTTYTTLTTPDQVTNVVVPYAGIIGVMYTALWQDTVASNGQAAIFLGSTQLKAPGVLSTGPASAPPSGSTANDDDVLYSVAIGLVSASGVGNATQATTGETITPPSNTSICWIIAAPGTYTVSIRFKTASGTLTVKSRKLWVFSPGMIYG